MSESFYRIDIRRRRHRWLPWRKTNRLLIKVRKDGQRLQGLTNVEWKTSLMDPTEIKINGILISHGQIWYEGRLHVEVPGISSVKVAWQAAIKQIDPKGEIQAYVADWSRPDEYWNVEW